MLELVFKYPEKKPPFFGIKFDVETEAMMLNQRWVSEINREWCVRIELIGVRLELTVFSKKEFKHTYVVYKYDRANLKKFMREQRQNDKINFGHIVENKDGSHKAVRTSVTNKAWVLPITKLEIYNEH